jgi:hypothetical protein
MRFVCDRCLKELTAWWYHQRRHDLYDREAVTVANRGRHLPPI